MTAHRDELAHLATKDPAASISMRLDATLPDLATKADMYQMGNRLLFWLTGTLVTCLLTFYGLHSSMMENLTRAEQQELQTLKQLTQSIDARLERLEAKEERRDQVGSIK